MLVAIIIVACIVGLIFILALARSAAIGDEWNERAARHDGFRWPDDPPERSDNGDE